MLFYCQDEKGMAYLEESKMYNTELTIDTHILPIGIHVFYFQMFLSIKATGMKTSDFYLVRIFSVSFFNV